MTDSPHPFDRSPDTPPDRMDEIIIVGRLGAPHGVRGEIHIHSYTSPAENLLDYRPWVFRRRPPGRKGSRRTALAAWKALEVGDLRSHQDHYLGRIDGFAEREDVATLKGMEIGVPRHQLPEPSPDEFYWRDLIGSRVVDTRRRELGVVCGLMETGVHDVLRVRPPASSTTTSSSPTTSSPTKGQSELLIPFVEAYVVAVSADEIQVEWDPTWLE